MEGGDPLSNPRHERFALLLASGEASAAEAYRSEISQRASKATVETEGPKLARSPQVALRIEWLKSQVAEKAKEQADEVILSMVEKRKICAQIARAGEKDSDRLKAIQVDNDLAGDGSEANKEMVVVVKIGGTDNADD